VESEESNIRTVKRGERRVKRRDWREESRGRKVEN